jgi:hypothetical protein
VKIESVDLFYLRMPEVLDIGDGSQDSLLCRVSAGMGIEINTQTVKRYLVDTTIECAGKILYKTPKV